MPPSDGQAKGTDSMESDISGGQASTANGLGSRYRPLTPWTAPKALAATIAILVVSGVAGVGAFKLIGRLAGLETAASDRPFEAIIWLGLSQLVMIALTFLAARRLGGKPAEVLAFGAPAGGARDYGLALVQMAALLAAFNALAYFVFKADLLADLKPFLDIIRHPGWLLALLVIGIGAPLSEEFLFRGFLQSALARSRLGFWPGAGLSTGIWALLHFGYSWVGIVDVVLIGGLFSWLLWRTGSTRVTVFCHAVYNTALTLVMRFFLV